MIYLIERHNCTYRCEPSALNSTLVGQINDYAKCIWNYFPLTLNIRFFTEGWLAAWSSTSSIPLFFPAPTDVDVAVEEPSASLVPDSSSLTLLSEASTPDWCECSSSRDACSESVVSSSVKFVLSYRKQCISGWRTFWRCDQSSKLKRCYSGWEHRPFWSWPYCWRDIADANKVYQPIFWSPIVVSDNVCGGERKPYYIAHEKFGTVAVFDIYQFTVLVW